jgi:RNA polymerase sigma factor (TIGR02999 family)
LISEAAAVRRAAQRFSATRGRVTFLPSHEIFIRANHHPAASLGPRRHDGARTIVAAGVRRIASAINEAYLRLAEWQPVAWKNREHFVGLAAQMMRHVLVDFARARQYAKRGGAAQQIALDEAKLATPRREAEIVALDDALKTLAELDARKCLLVELRYFGGLSVEETARVMQLSPRTVLREWQAARAWLYRELKR